MAEAGGTTTQSGIYYQNSIAAVFIGGLLDSRRRPTSDQVVEVRVEAPAHVDDIVVRHGDGNYSFIQAKESLVFNGTAWGKLWADFANQASSFSKTGSRFDLVLAIGRFTDDADRLREICARAQGKLDSTEWWNALSKRQRVVAEKVVSAIPAGTRDAAFSLIARVKVWIWPLDRIEPDYVPLWIPESNIAASSLFRILRDMVGGEARVRGIFRSPETLERLLSADNVAITDSPYWGSDAYRKAIATAMGRLSVPGTSLSGPIQDLFMWPQLREQSRNNFHRDFEEEDLRWRWDHAAHVVDLKDYPRSNHRRAVVNAGAGFGKTTLFQAIACRLCEDPIFLPVLISLDALAAARLPLLEYLTEITNRDFGVRIDWQYLCEVGRATVLLDGLDELSDKDRAWVLDAITKFGGRFQDVSFLLGVRDSSALNAPLGVPLLEIGRLDDNSIKQFAEAYGRSGARVDPARLLEHSHRHPDLAHLLRIPLFLALVLATTEATDDLPRNRSELLEHYLSILFSPERYKALATSPDPLDDMRKAAELLAFRGLESDAMGLAEEASKGALRDSGLSAPGTYVERMLQLGVIRRSGPRIHFVYPIVQEYLAARWLVENAPNDVADRFRLVVRRPWAQAIQFALEMHPKASKIVQDQLSRPDDAFHTVLRLISRCVVNGANVDLKLRSDLGDRLASAWPSEAYSIRQSIGYLLCDGFCDPLPKEAEIHIEKGWALHYGGAEIVVARANEELTEKTLKALLGRNIEYQSHLHNWQIAVDAIAPKALDMYLARARRVETTEKEVDALTSLTMNLSSPKILDTRWNEVANDKTLPPELRLAAYSRQPEPNSTAAWNLVDEVLGPWFSGKRDKPFSSYFLLKIFWHLNGSNERFQALMQRTETPSDAIESLIDSLLNTNCENVLKDELLITTAMLEGVSRDTQFLMQLMLAIRSNQSACDTVTSMLPDISDKRQDLWCFHLGHFSKQIATEGLRALQSRKLDGERVRSMLGSLSVGLNFIMDPTTQNAGVLDKQHRHPAAPLFIPWISSLLDEVELQPIDRLRALDAASQIGCATLARQVPPLVRQILDSIETNTIPEGEQWEADNAIGCGIHLCERESLALDEDLLFEIVEKSPTNAAQRALAILSRQSDGRVIPRLLALYGRQSSRFVKEGLFSSLEKLAGRFGKRIVRDGAQLMVENW